MKKVIIILAALLVIMATAILACNSSQKESTNTEGLVASALSHDSLLEVIKL